MQLVYLACVNVVEIKFIWLNSKQFLFHYLPFCQFPSLVMVGRMWIKAGSWKAIWDGKREALQETRLLWLGFGLTYHLIMRRSTQRGYVGLLRLITKTKQLLPTSQTVFLPSTFSWLGPLHFLFLSLKNKTKTKPSLCQDVALYIQSFAIMKVLGLTYCWKSLSL